MLVLTAKFNDEIEIEHQGKKIRLFIKSKNSPVQFRIGFFGDDEMQVRRVDKNDFQKQREKKHEAIRD